MKKSLNFIGLILLFFCLTNCNDDGTPLPGGGDHIAPHDLEGHIKDDKIVKLLRKKISCFPEGVQVSIAVIDGEKTKNIGVIKKGYRLEVIDNKESVFEIGSVTKLFTNILVSDFINKNVIALEDKLEDKFSFPLKNGGDIKLSQLANHSSGLPALPDNMDSVINANPENPYIGYTTEMLEDYLKNEVELENPSGTVYSYSNLGTGLLGYVLIKKSQKTYETLLQDIILKPLAMTYSSSDRGKIDEKLLVPGIYEGGKEVSNWDFTDALIAAGGIKSNVIDMEKFIRRNFENDAVYSLPQQPSFQVSEDLKVGMGWHIVVDDEEEVLWHNGGTGGYTSSLSMIKKDKKAVIVLSNLSSFHEKHDAIDELSFGILETLQ